MKRISLALAVALCLMTANMAMAAGWITGSAHDFSGNTWSGGEICKPCHTPHNGTSPDVSSAIWAHTLSTNTYQMSYTAGTGADAGKNVAAATVDALDNYSRLCMGCHDGTIALDSFAGGSGTAGKLGANSEYNLGTDLSNDHPVGNTAKYTGDGNRFNITGTTSYGAVSVGTDDLPNGKAKLPLRKDLTGTKDVVSCGTCHNPHGAGTGTSRFVSLLRMPNTNSNLCLTCHIK